MNRAVIVIGIVMSVGNATLLPLICRDEEGCRCINSLRENWYQVKCACFKGQSLLEIGGDQLPVELVHLEVSGCKEVRILGGALSKQTSLKSVRAYAIGTLLMRKHAFLNSSAVNPLFQAEHCNAVVFESNAWRGTKGPHSVALDECGHVVIQPSSFSWLQDFRARKVTRLELQKNAFSQYGASIGKHGPATAIVVEDAMLPEIPSNAFPSSAAEIRIERSEIRALRRDAFCGLAVLALTFHDCSIGSVERGALSARTLVHRLTLDKVKDITLHTEAIQSAVTNLIIQNSRVKRVSEGAVNITVATVGMFQNSFQLVSSRGFVFKDWNILEVHNNSFSYLHSSGIYSISEHRNGVFAFTENTIGETNPAGGALHFGLTTPQLDITVNGNRFNVACQCGQQSWLRREIGPKAGEMLLEHPNGGEFWSELFHNTSLCVVTNVLARCFSDNTIEIGYMNMTTFWLKVCEAKAVINCKGGGGDSGEIDVIFAPINSFDSSSSDDKGVTLFVALGSLLVLACVLPALVCVARRQSRSANKFLRLFCQNNNNLSETLPTVLTHSIDHLPGDTRNIKRRRRRRPRRRDMGVTVHEDFELTDVTVGSSSESEAGTCSTFNSYLAPSEDKATQTVPEPDDLTEEILEELKKKLDDPNAYSEARDTIEHMYDLIKIESSKQRQQLPSTSRQLEDSDDEEDDTYAVIPATCSEYQQPKDQRQHVYTELPGRALVFFRSLLPAKKNDAETAAVSEYMEPTDARVHVYTELAGTSMMANRPLPEKPHDQSML